VRRLWRDRVFVVAFVVAAVALLALVLTVRDTASPVPARGGVVELRDVHDLRDAVGQQVSAQGARVQSVPADEGFWVTADGGDRVWVQIETTGESPFVVEPGTRVSFTGQVVAHESDFVASPDFPTADAADLVDAGAHIEADVKDVHLG